jgi:hypothetical protein
MEEALANFIDGGCPCGRTGFSTAGDPLAADECVLGRCDNETCATTSGRDLRVDAASPQQWYASGRST